MHSFTNIPPWVNDFVLDISIEHRCGAFKEEIFQ